MADKKKPAFPLVHTNGTGKVGLTKQLTEAVDAVYKARAALGEAAPHGRDYYPRNDDSYAQARREHDERDAALSKVEWELRDILWEVSKQGRKEG